MMKTIQRLLLMLAVVAVIGMTVMSSSFSNLEAIAKTEETPQNVLFTPDEVLRPGSTSFSVSGLGPYEQVEMTIIRPNGEKVTHRSRANAQGIFDGTISVKEIQPLGEYEVSITGLDSQKLWKGVFTVTTAPTPTSETSETIPNTTPDAIDMDTQLDKSLQNLQNQVNSLENQIKTYRGDPKVVNWFLWWWQIGFWAGILWIFLWIFVGWQWTRFKFWRFGWPCWPWWFWIPMFWFIPWLVIGCWQWWWPIGWVWWIWPWWFFPWVFWAFWWVIIFKEAIIWLWRKK